VVPNGQVKSCWSTDLDVTFAYLPERVSSFSTFKQSDACEVVFRWTANPENLDNVSNY
jgi:hypothetical protein